jgi:Flp pilus assembly protein TadD
MVCRDTGRLFRVTVLAALFAVGLALPVAAQNLVVGKVSNVQGEPVEGATITISQPSSGRKYETKSGKDGTYTQVGLIAGAYEIVVSKEGVGESKGQVNVRGGRVPANFVLGVSAGEGMSRIFEEGVALSAAGDFDAAIVKFTEALKTNPECADCYYNIGVANAGKKDYASAEAAYAKSIEQKPSAEAYNGLAQALTAQRKSDEASAAAKKAAELMAAAGPAGGGDPDALVNQGKIFINAGNMADAKTQFQSAIAAKPDHADAHFFLGNVLVGEGNFGEAVAEFETYLKFAPTGPNAKQAQDNVNALKPLVK